MQTLTPAQVDMKGGICTAVTGPVVDVYTATIGEDNAVVEVTDDTNAVLVGDFVYFLLNKPGEIHNPTWLHMTAAEYAKWM